MVRRCRLLSDVGQEMKTSRDTSFRHFPWDIALASGVPLILPFALLAILQAVPSFAMLVLVMVSSGIALAGGIGMSWAKLPLYRQGRFFTMGSVGLDEQRTKFYRVGFRLSVIGIVAGAVLVGILCMPG